MCEAVDQSQHTDPTDQSEHIALFRRRGFIETETKQRLHPKSLTSTSRKTVCDKRSMSKRLGKKYPDDQDYYFRRAWEVCIRWRLNYPMHEATGEDL